jgi:ABC-2 type transport system permease protein
MTGPNLPEARSVSATVGTSAGGSIYDLGYRGYEGPRLGRRHAIRALLNHTVRVCYGIGRGGRAKLPPIVLGGIATVPAVIAIAFIALARQAGGQAGEAIDAANPLRHDSYFGVMTPLVVLFCAAQVPEIVGRDQRHNLLSLYFSRALRRVDYAAARYAGVVLALVVFLLLPQFIIFVGEVLAAPDFVVALREELGLMPAIVGQAALMAILLGAIATTVSAFTPRRLYATIAIVVILAMTPVVTNILAEINNQGLLRILVLLSPGDVLDASNAFLFDANVESQPVIQADLPGQAFVAAALLGAAACLFVLVRRYRGISA